MSRGAAHAGRPGAGRVGRGGRMLATFFLSGLAVAFVPEASAEIKRGLMIDRPTWRAAVIPDRSPNDAGLGAEIAPLESFIRSVNPRTGDEASDLAADELVVIRFTPGPAETVIRVASVEPDALRELLGGCAPTHRGLLAPSVQTVDDRFVYVEWACGADRPEILASVQITGGRVRRAFFHVGQALPLAGVGETRRPMVRIFDEERR